MRSFGSFPLLFGKTGCFQLSGDAGLLYNPLLLGQTSCLCGNACFLLLPEALFLSLLCCLQLCSQPGRFLLGGDTSRLLNLLLIFCSQTSLFSLSDLLFESEAFNLSGGCFLLCLTSLLFETLALGLSLLSGAFRLFLLCHHFKSNSLGLFGCLFLGGESSLLFSLVGKWVSDRNCDIVFPLELGDPLLKLIQLCLCLQIFQILHAVDAEAIM